MSTLGNSIRAARDLGPRPVDIPAWPHLDDEGKSIIDPQTGKPECTYYVRKMRLSERNAFDKVISTNGVDDFSNPVKQFEKYYAELLVRTLCDENGERIFGDNETDVIGGKAFESCVEAFKLSHAINGLGGEAKNS
jgi:hypothetical protein